MLEAEIFRHLDTDLDFFPYSSRWDLIRTTLVIGRNFICVSSSSMMLKLMYKSVEGSKWDSEFHLLYLGSVTSKAFF